VGPAAVIEMGVLLHNRRMSTPSFVFAGWWAALIVPAQAQPAAASPAPSPVVVRCPGPPVLYADNLSPQEVLSRNCKPLSDLPLATAPSGLKPSAAPSATPPASSSPMAASASPLPEARVRADEQRVRDAEARRILEAELRREEARLQEAIKAAGGAKPGDRAAADGAQIRRAESDIEAIRRELARLR
jgi:hypothetical protein